ncbi:MAG TPA: hypothetical protein VFP34_17645 [Microlunatus sp.]|nr:hypothetical protein [Microlunatus sp.]
MIISKNVLAALNGALASPTATVVSGSATTSLTVKNGLPVDVTLLLLDPDGDRVGWSTAAQIAAGRPPITNGADGMTVKASTSAPVTSWYAGGYLVALASATGSFVCLLGPLPTAGMTSLSITSDLLLQPNGIGPMPTPSDGVVVPPDSPRVLVGCGVRAGIPVVREQFWHRTSDSTPLAANEVMTYSTTVTNGVQDTTSSEDQLSTSIGLSGSGGWGPISATLSSTLSMSSSTFQQVVTTSESTTYNMSTINNNPGESSFLLYWQLTDIVSVLDGSGHPTASVVTGVPPVLVAKHPAPTSDALTTAVPSTVGHYRLTASVAGSTVASTSMSVARSATLILQPSTAPATVLVGVGGSGFPPSTALSFKIESTPGSGTFVALTTSPTAVTTDAYGSVPAGVSFAMPSGVAGTYTVSAATADGSVSAFGLCTLEAPSLSVQPVAPEPGGSVAVAGRGFPPSTSVSFALVDDANSVHSLQLTASTSSTGELLPGGS